MYLCVYIYQVDVGDAGKKQVCAGLKGKYDIYTHIHIYICLYIYIHMYTYIYLYIYMCIYVFAYMDKDMYYV